MSSIIIKHTSIKTSFLISISKEKLGMRQ